MECTVSVHGMHRVSSWNAHRVSSRNAPHVSSRNAPNVSTQTAACQSMECSLPVTHKSPPGLGSRDLFFRAWILSFMLAPTSASMTSLTSLPLPPSSASLPPVRHSTIHYASTTYAA
eukprot:3154191-Rhodomonas_salina.4